MGKKGKVLIVDDSKALVELITKMLQDDGYFVSSTQSGSKVLDLSLAFSPELIILDLSLPDLSGFEVCKLLKSNPKTQSIPIIFVTAHTDSKSIVDGFKVGAVDYITKPFQKEELIARVYTHIKLFKLNEKLRKQSVLLKHREARLKELNTEKNKFFSIIAHDLKAPLNNIKGLTELIRKKYSTNSKEEVDVLITHLFNTTVNTQKLLNNLLDWAIFHGGSFVFNPEMVNLSELVNTCLKSFEGSALDKSIVINNQVNKNVKVFADVNMLNTVLRNLISNAIKFTEFNGNITINAEHNEQMVDVSVADTGVGIHEKAIKNIFEISDSKSTFGTKGEQGTGLGLVLCNDFIQKHKGSIKVESKQGVGSTFTISLPNSKTAKIRI